MHEEMQEYKIILIWEAIYDVTNIADYIEEENGQQHADRFQSDLKEQMQNLSQDVYKRQGCVRMQKRWYFQLVHQMIVLHSIFPAEVF